jgi:TonB family protein
MNRPVMLSGRQPAYTREAVEAGVEGKMLVNCVITVRGELDNCRVIKSLPGLDAEVLSALKTQRYTPVTFDGRPVPVFYMFPFHFRLPPGARAAGPKPAPTTPPPGPGDTEPQYAGDLRSICHVHELSGQPPDKGLRAAAPWLTDHVHTTRARRQLAQMPHVDLFAWLQNLRREAAARAISPCPFADTWEEILKRPP